MYERGGLVQTVGRGYSGWMLALLLGAVTCYAVGPIILALSEVPDSITLTAPAGLVEDVGMAPNYEEEALLQESVGKMISYDQERYLAHFTLDATTGDVHVHFTRKVYGLAQIVLLVGMFLAVAWFIGLLRTPFTGLTNLIHGKLHTSDDATGDTNRA